MGFWTVRYRIDNSHNKNDAQILLLNLRSMRAIVHFLVALFPNGLIKNVQYTRNTPPQSKDWSDWSRRELGYTVIPLFHTVHVSVVIKNTSFKPTQVFRSSDLSVQRKRRCRSVGPGVDRSGIYAWNCAISVERRQVSRKIKQ